MNRRYFGYDYLRPSICHMFMSETEGAAALKTEFLALCRSQEQELSQEIRLEVVPHIDVFSDLDGRYYLAHVDGTEMMLKLRVIPSTSKIREHYVGKIAFEDLGAGDADALCHSLFRPLSEAEYLERYAEKITRPQ